MESVEKSKKVGYRLGAMMAYTFGSCFIAIVIALTVKLLLWMF